MHRSHSQNVEFVLRLIGAICHTNRRV